MLILPIVLRCALLVSVTSEGWACVCGGYLSAKQAWQRSPVVFAGYVGIAIPSSDKLPQIVAVQVEESFKGSHKGELFFLLQPVNDCSPRFKTGQRVLFYLYAPSAGLWQVIGCSRTAGLESAVDDLRFLRALPGSADKNRLAGVVALYENSLTEGFRRVRAVSNVHVHLRSQGNSVEATTDAGGVYERYNLPRGNYHIAIDVPKGLRILFPIVAGGEGRRHGLDDLRTTEPAVEIDGRTTADVDFVLVVDNQISGRVVNSAASRADGSEAAAGCPIRARRVGFADGGRRRNSKMFVARFAVRAAVLCLLAAPGAALAQSAPMQSTDSPSSRVTNRVLTKVVIYGSIGAIVGALGSLRKRGAADTIDSDDRTSNP